MANKQIKMEERNSEGKPGHQLYCYKNLLIYWTTDVVRWWWGDRKYY